MNEPSRINPWVGNGRWHGRALEWAGVRIELAGLAVQKLAAWLRWHDPILRRSARDTLAGSDDERSTNG